MVDVKSLCHLTILLLTLCFMLVKCSLEPTDQFIDNPTEAKQDAFTMHKRPSFFVGSRYGRSGSSSSAAGSSLYATSKTRRLNVVPRNDRFFLSSRYGKRAGMDIQRNNDNALRAPLSTPYEQALISEISTGTQLSNKPDNVQQLNNDFNTAQNTNHALRLVAAAAAAQHATPPFAYMSCIYTGLQSYYRCNSIDSMYYFKNAVINDDNKVLSTDASDSTVNYDENDNDDNDDNVNIDNDVDDDENVKK